jgi:hypothetical protein
MTLSNCQQSLTHSKVKVEEGRRKAVFLNETRDQFLRTKVDGCLVKDQTASDWVVSKLRVGDVIVELKGTDVDHAVRQILITAMYWTLHQTKQGALAALIVCSQYPRVDTKIQRAQRSFARKHKGPLHVVSHNCEVQLEHVLSFNGPFKV